MQPNDKFDYADPKRVRNLVKNYSQFVSFPIYTWQEKSQMKEVNRIGFDVLFLSVSKSEELITLLVNHMWNIV